MCARGGCFSLRTAVDIAENGVALLEAEMPALGVFRARARSQCPRQNPIPAGPLGAVIYFPAQEL